MTIAIIVIVVLLVAVVGWAVLTYNGLVRLRHLVQEHLLIEPVQGGEVPLVQVQRRRGAQPAPLLAGEGDVARGVRGRALVADG